MKKYRKLEGEFNMGLVPTKMLKGISKAQKCNFKSPAICIGIDGHHCGIIWKHPCGEWVLTARHSLTADTMKKCLIIMSDPEMAIKLIKEHKKSEKQKTTQDFTQGTDKATGYTHPSNMSYQG